MSDPHERENVVGDFFAIMLYRLFTTAALFAFLFASNLARSEDMLKANLESRYAALKTAMTLPDSSAIKALLAPGFVSIDVHGRSKTEDEVIADIMHLKPDPHKSSTTTLLSIKADTTRVIVEQQYDMKTFRTDQTGTEHQVHVVARSTDTWVRPAGEWLVQQTITDELSVFDNGKMVAHQLKP